MTKDKKAFPPPIYHGDQDRDRLPYSGPPIRTRAGREEDIGRRAPKEGSGAVVGSGASAGGTGGPSEDPDVDPIGGGGGDAMPRERGSKTEPGAED